VFNNPFVFLENHFINRLRYAIKYMFYMSFKKKVFCGKNGNKPGKQVVVSCRGRIGGGFIYRAFSGIGPDKMGGGAGEGYRLFPEPYFAERFFGAWVGLPALREQTLTVALACKPAGPDSNGVFYGPDCFHPGKLFRTSLAFIL
jgi:hypothetical protein